MRKFQAGFTVVELTIVITVIAILATITLVAYNGATDRAEYAHAQTDLKHINDALTIYKSQTGSYPTTNSTWTYQYPNPYSSTLNTSFLSDLVPNYLDKMPIGKANPSYWFYSYGYDSNGTDYKLLRIAAKNSSGTITGLPAVEMSNNPLLDTPAGRNSWAWGYWTDGAATW